MVTLRNPWLKKCARAASTIRCRLASAARFLRRDFLAFLMLEGAQAGLSWITIVNKRKNYRKAFDGFRAEKIARYRARDVRRLLGDAGIIRNRLKIAATVQNAKMFVVVREEFGTFDAYI